MILLTLIAIILILFVILIILFIFGIVHIVIDAKFVNEKPDVKVKILLGKIKIATISLPQMEMNASPFRLFFKSKLSTSVKENEKEQSLDEHDIKKMKERFQSLISMFKNEGETAENLLKMIRVHDIKWATTLGVGEADLTALAVGIAWTIKFNIIGQLNKWLQMEQPVVDVRPAFQEMTFQTHMTCMITFKLGKAILAAYRIAKKRKGRHEEKCQSIQYKA